MDKSQDLDGRAVTDRRSFIRKSLIVGGLAATAPVVTSAFSTPASAASSGQYRVRYQRSGNLYTGPTDVATPQCAGALAGWGSSTFLALDIAIGGSANNPSFTLQGVDSNCVFTSGWGQTAADQTNCLAGSLSDGGRTITFSGGIILPNRFVYLLVSCT